MELGTGHMPDPHIVGACLAGLKNVLRWAGMIEGEIETRDGDQRSSISDTRVGGGERRG